MDPCDTPQRRDQAGDPSQGDNMSYVMAERPCYGWLAAHWREVAVKRRDREAEKTQCPECSTSKLLAVKM